MSDDAAPRSVGVVPVTATVNGVPRATSGWCPGGT